jgi:YidC/Oxa1 family membrane protein insertase
MDTRDKITVGVLIGLVVGSWLLYSTWFERHYPAPPPQASTQPSVISTVETSPATTQADATTGPTTGPVVSAGLHAIEAQEGSSTSAMIGSADKKTYAMQVFLTARGAGVEKVILNDFMAEVSGPRAKTPYTFEEAYKDHPGTEPLASQSVVINGTEINLLDAPWRLIKSDANSATYRILVADGQTPIAEVSKTYTLSPRNPSDEGFEVHVDQTVRALSDRALNVKQAVNGPTEPPREIERGGDLVVLSAYADKHQKITIEQHADESGEFKPGAPTLDLTQYDKNHVLWAGHVSTYFNALVLPKIGEFAQGFSVHARALDPDQEDRHVAMTFETDPVDIKASGQQASFPLYVYLGPKSRGVLRANGCIYTSFPRAYDMTLVIRSGPCGYCAWDWLIDLLFYILWFFHAIFRDWGVAIICLVLLVRAALHPLTRSGQIHMMKMQKMAPEMNKLKEKYAHDKEALNQAMMEYQKEAMPAQLMGCLPMFLQMPIWIALWSALQSTFELRQAPFLYGLTWIKDLARPDALVSFPHAVPIPLIITTLHVQAINILPVLMAVATYVNQKYFMPKPTATMTPEQEQTQKMTQVMSMFFPLMFYAFPSGLNIYYLTSMTLGIVESKIIRDHIKQREEAEKAGKVFVETRATRGARQRGDVAPEPKKGGLMQKFTNLQKRIEDMAKEQQKNKGKGKKS